MNGERGIRALTGMRMTRREALSAAAGLAAATAAAATTACFSSRPEESTGPRDDEEVVVEMTTQLTFSPRTVRVQPGQTVVFRNASTFPHTATGDPDKARDASHVTLPGGADPWDSGTLTGGQEFRISFTVPGRYDYVCLPHELSGMQGTVVVEE